jgi:hypothetical protein
MRKCADTFFGLLMRKRRAAPKFSHPPRGAWRKATGLGAFLGQSSDETKVSGLRSPLVLTLGARG